MKRKYPLMLAAILAVSGLVWGPALHGNTKISGNSAKRAASTQVPEARKDTAAPPAAPNPQLSRLTGISIQMADSGKGTTIDISTSRSTDYRVIHLENPDRLVLDLEGAINSTNRWRYSSHTPLLARVRVGRFSPQDGGIIRVVADLRGHCAYHVDRQPTGFRIELTPKDVGPQQEKLHTVDAGVRSRKPIPAGKPAAKQEVAQTTPRSPADHAVEKPAAYSPKVVALRSASPLPSTRETATIATDPQSAFASPKPLKKKAYPHAVQAARAARVVTKTQQAALSHVVVPVSQSTELRSGPRYTGKRISLNLKGVDLKDFFRLIHEVSGLNIIVDSDVSGSVTVVLDDVPWDQALALVLNDNGLGDQLEGNVLRIAKISTLTREQEEEKKLSISKEDSAPLVTVFRHVNYAKAATLAALLKTWVGGGALSRRGSVLVDERTNTLIISDIASHIPMIESVVSKLDKKGEQVSIQARIIRATSDFARNLSTALSLAQRNGSGSLVSGAATGNPVSGEPLSPPSITTSPATGFGVFVLSNLGRNYAINAAIAAAETHDQAKTISEPSIVTQNNVEGTVIQGTQIPIQTTINNTISVQYVQASLQLKVTPQVTQDGNVFLTIDVQNSSPGPALTLAGPTINTQSATTQVLVPNGGTVVFGGVTVHTKSSSSTGVPGLEKIPILGHLFKSTTTQRNDQELLFFVTPKILT